MHKGRCAYCGAPVTSDKQKEHVFPRCLYPEWNTDPKVQRLTVPACSTCNNSWADDEAHFRIVVAVSGEANEAVRELWDSKILRALHEVDGLKRKRDLWEIMRTVKTDEGEGVAIYPGESEAVMRVVRKIIRGLSYHHELMWPVSDEKVWADVGEKRGATPGTVDKLGFLDEMEYHHRDKKIVEWWYAVVDYKTAYSFWLIRFYERTTFVGGVMQGGNEIEEGG